MRETLDYIRRRPLKEFIQKKLFLAFAKKREQAAAEAAIAAPDDEDKLSNWQEKLSEVEKRNKVDRHIRAGYKVLKLFYPDKEFVYYFRGSSGLVYMSRTEPGKVYKVATLNRRHETTYPDFDFPQDFVDYFREEELKIKQLSDSGVTPKYYESAGFEGYEEHFLERPIPVLVMERVIFDANWRTKLPLEKIEDLIKELFDFVQSKNLRLGDTEVVYESHSDKLRIIDLGGVSILDQAYYEDYDQFYKKVMGPARNRKR